MEKAAIISLLASTKAEIDRQIASYTVSTDIPAWLLSVRHGVTTLITLVSDEGKEQSVKAVKYSLDQINTTLSAVSEAIKK